MKLSDIKGYDALDVIADLMEPMVEISLDDKFREMVDSDVPKLVLVKHVLKEHKESIVKIIAILKGIPVEEYEFTLASLMKDILELLNDSELENLFTSQSQETQTSSGSAMENTEDVETK